MSEIEDIPRHLSNLPKEILQQVLLDLNFPVLKFLYSEPKALPHANSILASDEFWYKKTIKDDIYIDLSKYYIHQDLIEDIIKKYTSFMSSINDSLEFDEYEIRKTYSNIPQMRRFNRRADDDEEIGLESERELRGYFSDREESELWKQDFDIIYLVLRDGHGRWFLRFHDQPEFYYLVYGKYIMDKEDWINREYNEEIFETWNYQIDKYSYIVEGHVKYSSFIESHEALKQFEMDQLLNHVMEDESLFIEKNNLNEYLSEEELVSYKEYILSLFGAYPNFTLFNLGSSIPILDYNLNDILERVEKLIVPKDYKELYFLIQDDRKDEKMNIIFSFEIPEDGDNRNQYHIDYIYSANSIHGLIRSDDPIDVISMKYNLNLLSSSLLNRIEQLIKVWKPKLNPRNYLTDYLFVTGPIAELIFNSEWDDDIGENSLNIKPINFIA